MKRRTIHNAIDLLKGMILTYHNLNMLESVIDVTRAVQVLEDVLEVPTDDQILRALKTFYGTDQITQEDYPMIFQRMQGALFGWQMGIVYPDTD